MTANKKPRIAPPRIVFDAPPQLIAEIKQRSARDRTTVRVTMLDALRAYGFNVPDEEIINKRHNAKGRPRKSA